MPLPGRHDRNSYAIAEALDHLAAWLCAEDECVEGPVQARPGGVIESRDRVIAGLRAFTAVDSITIENERVVRHGTTAIVLNRLVIHGVIEGPVGQIGPTSVMTVFHRRGNGMWSAVSRALARCDPRAVARGIC